CNSPGSPEPSRNRRQPLRRGDAAVVGGIIIVAGWTTDRRGSAVIAWPAVISTCGSSTNRSSTDAHRHARAYTTVIATTVSAATIDTTTINATSRDTSAIC